MRLAKILIVVYLLHSIGLILSAFVFSVQILKTKKHTWILVKSFLALTFAATLVFVMTLMIYYEYKSWEVSQKMFNCSLYDDKFLNESSIVWKNITNWIEGVGNSTHQISTISNCTVE